MSAGTACITGFIAVHIINNKQSNTERQIEDKSKKNNLQLTDNHVTVQNDRDITNNLCLN